MRYYDRSQPGLSTRGHSFAANFFLNYVNVHKALITTAPTQALGAAYNRDSERNSLAIAYQKNGDFECDRASADPAQHDAALKEAGSDYAASRDEALNLVKDNPNRSDYWHTLGEARKDLLFVAEYQANGDHAAGRDSQAEADYKSVEQEQDNPLVSMIEAMNRSWFTASADEVNDRKDNLAIGYRVRGDFERGRAGVEGDPTERTATLKHAESDYAASRDEEQDLVKDVAKDNADLAWCWVTLGNAHHGLANVAEDQAKAAIKAGDKAQARINHQTQDQESDAHLDAMQKALSAASTSQHQDREDRLNSSLGYASYARLFTGRYVEAQQAAEQGLKNDPTQVWIYTNEAHALLFQGRYDEALGIYTKHAFEPAYSGEKKTFAEYVLDDFKDFEAAGFLFTSGQLTDIQKVRAALQALTPSQP